MKKIHNKLISLLEQHKSLSMRELQLLTGQTNSGLRGRLSELRKQGYQIDLEDHIVKQYVYKGKPEEKDETTAKLEHLLESENLFGTPIQYDKIATILKTDPTAVKNSVINLFHRYHIMQLSPTKVIISKK